MDFRPHLSHTLSPTSLITVNGGPEAAHEGKVYFGLRLRLRGIQPIEVGRVAWWQQWLAAKAVGTCSHLGCVRRQRREFRHAGDFLLFFFFSSSLDPSSWNKATHIRVALPPLRLNLSGNTLIDKPKRYVLLMSKMFLIF